jgi:hypothetical protein
MDSIMSKESKIKKRLEKINQQSQPEAKPREPVKTNPVTVKPRYRYKLNRRFIIMLIIWIIAFVLAMVFLYRR